MTDPDSSTGAQVLRLPRNQNGRDFCVGDIHGMFGMLDRLLEAVQFDKNHDRLLSVGDLVDRGPESLRALEFLAQPWFYAIRGNHEDMLLSCYENPQDQGTAKMWAQNGGDWWQDTDEQNRHAMHSAVNKLPLAIEVDTQIGKVGIVHADIPPGLDWDSFLARVEEGDEYVEQIALWSRTRARMHKIAGEISGIARVYCGHNIVDAPLQAGNVRYIDTGAYLPEAGQLTMVEISQAEEPAYHVGW